jgi:fucose permease
MSIVEKQFRGLFGTLFGIFVLYGTSMTMIGATLPRILADFHWDYVTVGTVIAGGSVAFFLSTFVSGYLVHSLGPKATALLGVALGVVGLAFFGAVTNPAVNFLLNVLVGLGQGAIEVTINSTVIRLDTRKTGSPIVFTQGAFAIGAIAGPLALGLLLHTGGSWTLVYRGMALLFAVLLVILAKLKFDLPAAPARARSTARLSAHPAYWLAFGTLFLYVGIEMGFSNWVAEYFVQSFQFQAAAGALLVSVFWAGILVGRLGVPMVSTRADPGRKLVLFAGGVALFLAALPVLGSFSLVSWTAVAGVGAVFAAGLGCSVIYGLVLTLVGATFPHAQSKAIGFAATGGGLGVFLFPYFGSILAQAWGIRYGIAAFAGFSILMVFSSLLLVRAARAK